MTDAGQAHGVEGPVLLDLVPDAGFEIPGRALRHGDEPLGGVHEFPVQLAAWIPGNATPVRDRGIRGDFPLLERLRVQDVLVAAPDHDHRVSRRCLVEIPPQGEPLLLKLPLVPVGVRGDQFAGAGGPGAFGDRPEQLVHGADPGEVHPVPAAGAVEMVVGQTGDDRFTGHFNDFGVRSDEVPDVRVRTYGQDPTVPDRQGLGDSEVSVHGEDGATDYNQIGLFRGITRTGPHGGRQQGEKKGLMGRDGFHGSVVNHECPSLLAARMLRRYLSIASNTPAGVRSGERKGSITRTSPSRWPCWRSSVRRTEHSQDCAAATMSASHHESA